MSRGKWTILAGLTAVALLIVPLPSDRAHSQDDGSQDVFVLNFPSIQEIDGTVAVRGHIRQGSMIRVKEVLVSPVHREETTRLIEGGILVPDGFTSVVLSLSGHIKGEVVRRGTVGAILLPEEESILRVLEEEGLYQFPIEVKASEVGQEGRYFASEQVLSLVGFPRYRIYFYNTTDKSVSVDLFAYLSS